MATPFRLGEDRLLILRRSRSFFLDAPLCCEINGKTSEPVSALVMGARNRGETRASMRVRGSLQRRSTRIITWQGRQDSFEHPGATQV